MRKRILYFLLVWAFFSSAKINAQYADFANEQALQLNLGTSFLSSDMGKEAALQFVNPRLSFGLGYSYRFHNRFDVGVNAYYNWGQAKDGNFKPNRGWAVSANLFDASANLRLYLVTRGKFGLNCPDLYIGVGAGVIASQPYSLTSQYNIDTKLGMQPLPDADPRLDNARGVYIKDGFYTHATDANLYDVRTTKKWEVGASFPISFGVKFNLTSKWLLGADYTLRISTNDYLDGISPAGSKMDDMCSSFTISLSYLLKATSYDFDLGKNKLKKNKASSGTSSNLGANKLKENSASSGSSSNLGTSKPKKNSANSGGSSGLETKKFNRKSGGASGLSSKPKKNNYGGKSSGMRSPKPKKNNYRGSGSSGLSSPNLRKINIKSGVWL